MRNFDYSRTADKYEEIATIQKAAADTLLDLLNIRKDDDVLDLGCGPGHLTKRIREITDGRVAGVDKYSGMIEQAKSKADKNIEFFVSAAEDVSFENEFDIVFSNSAFHWFSDPQKALDNCHRALREGGKLGIQCPATNNSAPILINAIDAVGSKPGLRETFLHFTSKCFFLDSIAEYSEFIEASGFKVEYAEIVTRPNKFDLQEMIRFFEKAGALIYINNDYYDVEITEEYRKSFLNEINTYFAQHLDKDGQIDFTVTRLYAIAHKL